MTRLALIGVAALFCYSDPAAAQTLQWARQFGAPASAAFGLAADSTGVYIAGVTYKGIPGQTKITVSGAQTDGFIRKYDPAGNILWTQEFAFPNPTLPQVPYPVNIHALAVDSTGVYVAGKTGPGGGGGPYENSNGSIAVVFKFDLTSGKLLWTYQSTSSKTQPGQSGTGIAASNGGVYLIGLEMDIDSTTFQISNNVYIRRLNPADGSEVWVSKFNAEKQLSGIIPFAVSADATGEYIIGTSPASLPGANASPGQGVFVVKYDPDGKSVWTDQFGSGFQDYPFAVSAGPSGVYVVGTTMGLLGIQTLPTFDFDGFIRKYDTNGSVQWTKQFGTIDREQAFGVTSDKDGAYVVGWTRSVLGAASLGGEDAFLVRYDVNGNSLWTLQTGSVNDDYAYGVAEVGSAIYMGGYTDKNTVPRTVNSSLGVSNAADPFVYKYSPPAPGGPVVGAVVNNASFAPTPQPVSAGSIAAVFGTGLNDGSQVLTSAFASNGKLVTTLGGASVTVGGIPAPMFYSTSSQLGIQVPIELAGKNTAEVQVKVGGQVSTTFTVNLASIKPGLFTVSQDGKGTAVCLHTDGVTPVTASNPAHPNEVVIMYGTGFGPVSPVLETGEPSSGNDTVNPPIVTIDGLSAVVQFSGVAPGFVGLNQINVVVPGLARMNSADPVVLKVNGIPANDVTLPVAPK